MQVPSLGSKALAGILLLLYAADLVGVRPTFSAERDAEFPAFINANYALCLQTSLEGSGQPTEAEIAECGAVDGSSRPPDCTMPVSESYPFLKIYAKAYPETVKKITSGVLTSFGYLKSFGKAQVVTEIGIDRTVSREGSVLLSNGSISGFLAPIQNVDLYAIWQVGSLISGSAPGSTSEVTIGTVVRLGSSSGGLDAVTDLPLFSYGYYLRVEERRFATSRGFFSGERSDVHFGWSLLRGDYGLDIEAGVSRILPDSRQYSLYAYGSLNLVVPSGASSEFVFTYNQLFALSAGERFPAELSITFVRRFY